MFVCASERASWSISRGARETVEAAAAEEIWDRMICRLRDFPSALRSGSNEQSANANASEKEEINSEN